MKRYSAAFTESAKKDIKESVDYIEFSLHNPSAADRLMDKIDEELENLEFNPYSCAVIDDPLLQTIGLRFCIVENYLLFYTVSEEEKSISVIRFLHGRRNWMSILRQSFTITD